MIVSENLGKWYDKNKRILPWRESQNPYYIWISEIILQQTRVLQGMDYYYRFIERFPTIFILSESSVEQVLKIWQGLGYYTRARNLHKTARIVVSKYEGKLPQDYFQLLQLPGIGEYTAGAIMSLAFNQPFPAIDGNVSRVLSRYFGIASPIDSAKTRKEFYQLALETMDIKNPGRHNQAMIELGALICYPRNPNCPACPISNSCYALIENKIGEFPKKKQKISIIHRYLYYMVIRKRDSIFIKQRSENDIWALLYDFPSIERKVPLVFPNDIERQDEWKNIFSDKNCTMSKLSQEMKHQLSHQIIHARFIEIIVDDNFSLNFADEVDNSELEKYPLPRLIDKYLSGK
jgi:A/G-specific adenine glycosylase